MNRELGRQSSREAISNPDTRASCIRASPARGYTPDAPIRPRPHPWGVPGKQRAKGKRRTLTIVARDHKACRNSVQGVLSAPTDRSGTERKSTRESEEGGRGGCPTFALNPGFLD